MTLLKSSIGTIAVSVILAVIFAASAAYLQLQVQAKDIEYIYRQVNKIETDAAQYKEILHEIRERMIVLETKLDIVLASKKGAEIMFIEDDNGGDNPPAAADALKKEESNDNAVNGDGACALDDKEQIAQAADEKKRRRKLCQRCGAELKKTDAKCPSCLAPSFWKN
ncbi:MAG: hypothetical protein LBU09_03265 [Endomicrobium sp.]|jgi:rubrerythrin|nr:hypothetical protein [Endomicrobium sp.]